jgi:hypothetical protein
LPRLRSGLFWPNVASASLSDKHASAPGWSEGCRT